MALRATRALLRASTLPPQTPTPPTTKPTILEVERKFRRLTVPTLTNIIHHNTTNNPTAQKYNPLFTSVQPLPTVKIHDIYYDTRSHILCSSGAWIRQRNGEWEAKVRRQGWKGDFVNSRFEEIRGKSEVGGVIAGILALEKSGSGMGVAAAAAVAAGSIKWDGEEGNFGLGKLAEFVTTREAWVVDGEFKVVRDRMDFGHEVGEVELQVDVGGDAADGEMGEEEKGVVMEEMDRKIEEFMKRYAWAWEEGEAVGKLTAYFEMVDKRGREGVKR
jgi:thiamine-triphosphatase